MSRWLESADLLGRSALNLWRVQLRSQSGVGDVVAEDVLDGARLDEDDGSCC